MKAVFFRKTGELSNIEYGELPSPAGDLLNGEVELEFIAGSLNHLDLWVLKGLPRVKYQFPQVAGADICGRVVASRSSKFREGDRVILYPGESKGTDSRGRPAPENLCEDFAIRGENFPGVFAERVRANERFVFQAPPYLSDAEAAALPLVSLTAWQMVAEKAAIRSGSSYDEPVLVHGAGSGVTQAIVRFLVACGVRKIGVTSRDSKKLEPYQKLGAKGFVHGEKTFEEIKAWAGKDRVSVIFDHVGESLFEMNIRLLRNGGKFITCGATSGYAANLDLRQLYFRQLQLLGSTMGSLKSFREMLTFMTEKQIRPLVSQMVPWEKPLEAYELMAKALQIGKIVFRKSN